MRVGGFAPAATASLPLRPGMSCPSPRVPSLVKLGLYHPMCQYACTQPTPREPMATLPRVVYTRRVQAQELRMCEYHGDFIHTFAVQQSKVV
jgi:hypothetical protein